MTMRRILVPLSARAGDGGALTLGLAVARELKAHLDALFVWPDPTEALPYLGEGVSGQVIEEIMHAAKEAAADAAAAAKRSLASAAAEAHVPVVSAAQGPGRASARFIEFTGRLADVVERASRLSDLVIFAEARPDDSSTAMVTIEAALVNAGRPVLIAPADVKANDFARSVAIAWDGSVEAAHAVSAALPFLTLASKVNVLTVRSAPKQAGAGAGGAANAGAGLMDYLALHGVHAAEHILEPQGRTVGQTLLEAAIDGGAGLLVMGGYGHSRLREFILGGTTRHILTHAMLPVLMSH
jgi:nucleotide-binding universal stress UspA family protein